MGRVEYEQSYFLEGLWATGYWKTQKKQYEAHEEIT